MIFLNIWPTTVEGWVGLIILIIGLISALAGLIPTLIKLKSVLGELASNKDYNKLIKVAKQAMVTAQASGKTGAEKQEMVVNAIKAGATELEIEVNDEDINNLINSIKDLKNFFNEMKAADQAAKQ